MVGDVIGNNTCPNPTCEVSKPYQLSAFAPSDAPGSWHRVILSSEPAKAIFVLHLINTVSQHPILLKG
jgi:hypothetical protein